MNLPFTFAQRYLFGGKFSKLAIFILLISGGGILVALILLFVYLAFPRYSTSKSLNAVNIISWVSIAGMMVGSLGLILILSVFNGFEGLVISLYNSFNPDFTITAKVGKSYIADSSSLQKLKSLEGVRAVSKVIEENALLTYGDKQYIATIKGVEDNYGEVTGIDSSMYNGVFLLKKDDQQFAVIGAGIEQSLGV